MTNPHAPSELLEEKLHDAGLTDMPHPKKLHPRCVLSVDRASMDSYHCDRYSLSLYIWLLCSYKYVLSQEMDINSSWQTWAWGWRRRSNLDTWSKWKWRHLGITLWVLPVKSSNEEISLLQSWDSPVDAQIWHFLMTSTLPAFEYLSFPQGDLRHSILNENRWTLS